MVKKAVKEEVPAQLKEALADPAKDATADILQFARKRSAWQQDALRRLTTKSALSVQDLAELLKAAKIEAGCIPIDSNLFLSPLAEAKLAKEMREADRRGEELGLTEDERAFYDALETNDSAVKVLGDENLRVIARELLETVRQNNTIDWAIKDSARAKLRSLVKRILRNHGYPPDKQEKATQTVLAQAELICKESA